MSEKNPYELARMIAWEFERAEYAAPVVVQLGSFDDGMRFYTQVRLHQPQGTDYRTLVARERWLGDYHGFGYVTIEGVEFRWPIPSPIREGRTIEPALPPWPHR